MSNAPILTETQLEAERAALRADMTSAQPLTAEELEAFRAINRDAGPACTMDFARRMLATIDASRRDFAAMDMTNDTLYDLLTDTRAELEALKARPVRVKQLVWREEWLGESEIPVWRGYDFGGVAQAYISFAGQYQIDLHSEVPAWEIEHYKAWKQADYERRILSALDLGEVHDQPVPAAPQTQMEGE